MNLNENLYKRFGLEFEQNKIRKGFCSCTRDFLLNDLDCLINPYDYGEPLKLARLNHKILREACRQTFTDFNDYLSGGFHYYVVNVFDNHGSINTEFSEYLVNLQILLNIAYGYKEIKTEIENLSKHINEYLEDYPILGIKLKIYRTKSPQLFPTISKFSDKIIDNTLGLLERENYKSVLEHFEDGLKEFLIAKDKSQLKDVVEDMYTACDELSKIILKQKNIGFKHVFIKDNYKKFGFSEKKSKEIYRSLKDWMDGIKHGTIKDFGRNDIEMIISLIATFIRFAVNNNT